METCPDSSHFSVTRVTITLSITQPLQHSGFQLQTSCLAGIIFIPLQDTLQVIERKRNTDLKQLNFWLDRRFGSTEGFSALTWFQHLAGNRFSIHLYPPLWSTSTWAACSQVPAWIWASGAAPAITAGIHPVKAKPATSCHCSENQQTLRKEKNLSLLSHFPKGEWATPQWLDEVQRFNLF